MTPDEFAQLKAPSDPARTIAAHDLPKVEDSTLLLGITEQGDVAHIFLREDRIERCVYKPADTRDATPKVLDHKIEGNWKVSELIEGLSLYPEAYHFWFSRRLMAKGFELSFAPFHPDRMPARFAGYVPQI